MLYVLSMSRALDPPRSQRDIARDRAARRDVAPGLVALLLTEGSLVLADPDASASVGNLVWSLSPLVAIGLLVGGQLRILGRCDERERVEQLTAMSVGFGAFAVLLAGAGVLQSADIGDAAQLTQITFIVGILAWVAALGILQRRAS